MFDFINQRFIDFLMLISGRLNNTTNDPQYLGEQALKALKDVLPIILIPFFILAAIAIIALVFGILNYRTNKKILKKLEEKKD